MTILHSSTLGIESSIPLIVNCNLVVVVGPYSVPRRGVGTFVGMYVIGLFVGCLDDGSSATGTDGSSLLMLQVEPFHLQSALLHCLEFV